MKVLGVAFEPWETEIIAATQKKLRDSILVNNSDILIADIWQLRNRKAKEKLLFLEKTYDFEALTLENEFTSWQKASFVKDNEAEISKLIIEWSCRNEIERSTLSLFKSDHLFAHFERDPFYKPLNRQKKLKIFYDIAVRITKIIETLNPDFIWCIERNYLVKNIIAELSKSKKIPMYTLVYTRIKDYYIFSNNFGLGVSEELKYEVNSIKESSIRLSKGFLNEFKENFSKKKQKKNSLYRGFTENRLEFLIWSKNYKIHALLHLFKKIILDFYRNFKQRKMFLPNTEVYGAVWWRVPIYQFLNNLRTIRYILFGIKGAMNSLPSQTYFYYPLHYRPESSTLTLGSGLDDEVIIEFICKKLPLGVKLAVKENPSIVGDRRKQFYKKITKNEAVILIDPLVGTNELAQNSIGVIGISGTALLEASLNGIPAHSVGQPEFDKFLTSNGLDNLEEFMVQCLKNKKTYNSKLHQYVEYVFKYGIKVQLGWECIRSSDNINNASTILSNKIKTLIYEYNR